MGPPADPEEQVVRPDQNPQLIAADPVGTTNPRLVVAAGRADGTGILDLADAPTARDALATVVAGTDRPFWVRPSGTLAGTGPSDLDLPDQVTAVVLAGDAADLPRAAAAWRAEGRRVVAQVVSVDEARAAVAAGCDGLLASGSEAGGRVGETESSILLQQVVDLGVPVWARGGIGLHTAAAAVAGGAAGVVVDAQLALTRESLLGWDARRAVGAMDGSETRIVGGHRVFTRPDLEAAVLDAATPAAEVAGRLGPDLRTDLVPVGQDGATAESFGRRFGTVGGVLQALRSSIDEHLAAARAEPPLAPGAGVAGPHGTRYPIAQGPMTRVSDRAEFARSVADGGGLPFLALALMSGPEVRTLLEQTAELLGDRPWGVGVLGFVPPEIRAEQLEAVHDVGPPLALIAGGRPSQATPLEEVGISTYLHVPSPGLLDRFLKDGARKFVFEGRECGGHVGPRSSFALWDAQIERLLAVDRPAELQVLFAGGIHDARSAAMVSAAAATLAARGARIGVLMGTAYLFTEESVQGGAIRPAFQDVAVSCERTVLLETSPGHATRCVESDYVRAFVDRKHELEAEGVDIKTQWAELETLNLGRLRMASKGLTRGEDGLVELDEAAQRRDGMYMIGEVATLRSEVTTVAALHADVSDGSVAWLASGDEPAGLGARDRGRVPDPLDVAIVGMDAFFPGAVGADEFWAEIVAGTNAITEVPADRWDTGLYYDADAFTKDAGRKTPSRWGGFLDRIGFDPLRYGIPPASLAAIEPVQLLSLEVAARALADAGYGDREFDRSRASVVFGAEAGNELAGAYGVRAFLPQLFGEVPAELEDHFPSLTEDSFPGVLTNVIAGRIANRLDLGGVNYTVDAACASSLAALDAACKELRSGVSDLVVCGGADLHNGLNDYLLFASVHALSPTGQCRTFDASADGIALGEGIACVVLKRRVDAERDGDRIYAVIDAVAGSSDGRHLGLTAPRKEGQQRAVERAWAQAGRPDGGLGLVEAHGTGTVVGDRTELATLTELFAEAGAAPGTAVLGSVKSQIGHTKCAAGLAGLIKAAKAVHHGVLPPTLNLVEPNPYYDAATSPFRFLDRAQPWPDEVRRAGVSAFGFGGTNFHAVLSSAPGAEMPAHGLDRWPAELFVLRAPSPEAARDAVADLASRVDEIRAADPDHLAAQLAAATTGPADPRAGVFVADPDGAGGPAGEPPKVAFLYPGQGSQRPGMLGDLFVAFPWLADLLRTGDAWADRLFPRSSFTREERTAQLAAITATDVAQPALGIAALAMTRVLGRLGIRPAVAAGHSYGELAALAAAGTFADDATLLAVSEARGRAILDAVQRTGGDPGAMAAVELAREDLQDRIAAWPDLVVANHNGPRQAVLSGPTASVEAAVAALVEDGVRAKQLPVACAFHSPVIAEAGELFAAALDGVALAAPSFPVWSNATAAPYPEGDAAAVARLLADQVVSPVRFVDQVEDLYAHGVRVFVEAGPGRVLTQQVGRILGDRPHAVVATDASGEHGLRRLLLAVAELATLGVPVDVATLFDGRAEPLVLRDLPVTRPGWLVDGAFVRTADGTPVANSLQPAGSLPALALGTGAGPGGSGSSAVDANVLEYLHNIRQLVAAERDVMLRYLGGAVPEAGRFDGAPTAIPATASPVDRSVAASASAPAAEAPAPTGPRPVLTGDALMAAVLGIVSDRTGYPVEMLDPDLDLEADLSIDSIKRIEIVGELAEKVGLPGMDESAIDEDLVEELAQLKTLRGIVAWIDDLAAADVPAGGGPAAAGSPGDGGALADAPTEGGADAAALAGDPASFPEGAPDVEGPDGGGRTDTDLDADLDAARAALPPAAERYVVRTRPAGPAVPVGDLGGARAVLVGEGSALLDALVVALKERGASVEQRRPPLGPEPSTDLAELIGDADVVVDLTTAGRSGAADARDAFVVLKPAILGRAARILAVTHQGSGSEPTGVQGLVRALAREVPAKLVRGVEVDDAEVADDDTRLAVALVDELLDPDSPTTVSWVGGRRTTRQVEGPVPLDPGHLALGPESVVVVTGGARGITAKVAEGLAAAGAPRLVLVGRSELPGDEDPRTVGAEGPADLRRALLAAGELRKPAEIEAAVTRTLADREIRATLAAVEAAGSAVEYHAVDVRSSAFAALLDDVRARHGRIDGVVHGAGVLDDRFARDKGADGFDRVYGTKVDGARTILDRRGPDTRFVVLFGSVSGVFGNRGQCDYAAANDTLDLLAEAAVHAGDGTGGRVVTIDWGPWGGGGMVSPELEREYARRGIGLVDPDDGVAALLAEIAHATGPAQVVVMRGRPDAFAPGSVVTGAGTDGDAGGTAAGG
jgi:acyl transferase domain-containing protein/NAD(P)H-dependent flavin oxidoreductase YrpB (nitropropane dioxygenase family)/NAD(P)-dependent dehydrogenase (short-subunit alcohol dehydrogenase family)